MTAERMCMSADSSPVAIGPGEQVVLQGNRARGSVAFGGGCMTSARAQELVYRVDVQQELTLMVSMHATGSTTIYLKASCDPGAEDLACSALASNNGTVSMGHLSPGSYYLVIDGVDFEAADQLTFEATLIGLAGDVPQGGATCDDAVEIQLGAEGDTILGDLMDATDDLPSYCDAAAGPEEVYRFTLAEAASIQIEWSGADAGGGLALTHSCGEAAEVVGCAPGTEGGLALPRLHPGTYYLVAQGAEHPGMFSFTVTSGPAAPGPDNDTCDAAQEVAFDESAELPAQVEVVGDLFTAEDDYATGCSANASWADVVYRVHVPQDYTLSARLVEPEVRAALAIVPLATCGDVHGEVACAGPGEQVVSGLLPEGDYAIVVDSMDVVATSFTLQVTLDFHPQGDTCAAPNEIELDEGGSAIVEGDTTAAGADYQGSCTGARGNDLVYHFTVDQPRGESRFLMIDPQVERPEDRGWDTVLYLKKDDCESEEEEVYVACNDDQPGWGIGSSELVVPRLLPGDYYLFADGFGEGSSGEFRLEIRLGAPLVAPANDTCDSPEEVTLDLGENSSLDLFQDLYMAGDDLPSGSCQEEDEWGGEVVYSLTIPEAIGLSGEARGAITYQILGGACEGEAALELACGGAEPVYLPRLEPGTYWVVVTGVRQDAGPFSLHLEALAPAELPANDTCDAPEELTWEQDEESGRLVATGVGNNVLAEDELAGSCGGEGGGDEVFHLFLDERSSLTVSVVSHVEGVPVVAYLRRGACEDGEEILCAVPGSPGAVGSVEPGDYFLVVDSFEATGGAPFDVVVTREQPILGPVNDRCESAMELEFDDAGVATVLATTEGAEADYRGSCTSARGSDVVFHFRVDQLRGESSFYMDAEPWGGWDTVLYLKKDDCESEDRAVYVGCDDDGPTGVGSSAFDLPELEPGDYYLFADGYSERASGTYRLTVTLGPVLEPPDNETCDQAQEIAITPEGVTLEVPSLRTAADDMAGSCGGEEGNDVFYRFTLDRPTPIGLSQESGGGRVAVYLFRAADGAQGCEGAEEVVCETFDGFMDSTVGLGVLEPGTYYLVLDGQDQDQRRVAITVLEALPPIDDTCGAPSEVQFDADGIAELSGTLDWATDLQSASCSDEGDPEVVWHFTLDEATGLGIFHPDDAPAFTVFVRRAACEGDEAEEIFCADFAGGREGDATIGRLSAGEYYLFVEGVPPMDYGLTLHPVDVPANDSCESPEELVFDEDGVATAHGTTVNASSLYMSDYCGFGPKGRGREVVYSFTLQEHHGPSIFSMTSGDFDTVLYMRRGGCERGEPVACNDDDGGRDRSGFTVQHLTPGTYYLFADTYATGDSGEFDITVRLGDVVDPVDGDTCDWNVPVLDLPTLDEPTLVPTPDFMAATSQYEGSCGGGRLADVVYEIDVQDSIDLALVGSVEGGDLYVWLRSGDCEDGEEITCSALLDGVEGASVGFGNLGPGTYYLHLAGPAGLTGDVSLITYEVPANDHCGAPAEVEARADGSGWNFSGDLTYAQDWFQSSCAPDAGVDLVYHVTLPREDDWVLVREDQGNPVSVFIRADHCGRGEEVFCGTLGGDFLDVTELGRLPAGDYYIFAEGRSGDFEASIRSLVAPANDTCEAALPLQPDDEGVSHIRGDFLFAQDDLSTETCGEEGLADLVFGFSLDHDAIFLASRAEGPGDLFMWLSHGPCPGDDEPIVCNRFDANREEVFHGPRLTPGEYLVFMEGDPFTVFSMDVTLALPPPGDACQDAQELEFDADGAAHVEGDTLLANNDYEGMGNCSSGGRGPDLVYQFTLEDTATVHAWTSVPGGVSWDTTLFLRTAPCEGEGVQITCDDDSGDGFLSDFTVEGLEAGTYYVIVDGYGRTTGGPFALDVTVDPPEAIAH